MSTIEAEMEELADALVRTRKSLVMGAVKQLGEAEMAAIGAWVEEGADAPFAATVDDDVEKLVDAYLAESAESGE